MRSCLRVAQMQNLKLVWLCSRVERDLHFDNNSALVVIRLVGVGRSAQTYSLQGASLATGNYFFLVHKDIHIYENEVSQELREST